MRRSYEGNRTHAQSGNFSSFDDRGLATRDGNATSQTGMPQVIDSAIKKPTCIGEGVQFSTYFQQLRLLEDAKPDNISRFTTPYYLSDLNLQTELRGLARDAVVVDLGCCGGVGTDGLKDVSELADLQLIGITPNIIPTSDGRQRNLRIPIFEGRADNLTDVLKAHQLGPADAILLRNVMEEICIGEESCQAAGITQKAFEELHSSVKPGGKVLIWDQYGTGELGVPLYDKYADLAREVGFNAVQLPCLPTRKRNGQCEYYMRLSPSGSK